MEPLPFRVEGSVECPSGEKWRENSWKSNFTLGTALLEVGELRYGLYPTAAHPIQTASFLVLHTLAASIASGPDMFFDKLQWGV